MSESSMGSSPEGGKRIGAIARLLFIVVGVLLFYAPLLRPDQMTAGADVTDLFYPQKIFAARSLAQSFVPLWNPYNFCGTPFLAAMQSAVFYPIDRILFASESAPLFAIHIYSILHLVWLGVGFALFLKTVGGVGPWTAALFGLLLPLSQHVEGHLGHISQIAVMAWFPWVMTLAFLLSRERRVSYFLGLAFAICFQFFAGHPQMIFMEILSLGVMGLFFGAREIVGGDRRLLAQKTLIVTAALLLGIVLASAQILPTAELAPLTYRGLYGSPETVGVAWSYALSFSIAPEHLKALIAPYALYDSGRGSFVAGYSLGEFGMYIGILPLLLSGAGLLAGRRRMLLRATAGVLVLLGFVFALGPATPVYPGLLKLFPPLMNYRAPSRFLFLSTFFLLLLAALGASVLMELDKEKNWFGRWRGTTAVSFVVVCALISLDLYWSSLPQSFRHLIPDAGWQEATDRPDATRWAMESELYRTFRLMGSGDEEFDAGDTPTSVYERRLRLQPGLNLLEQPPKALVYGYEEGLLPLLRFKDFLFTFNRNLRNREPDPVLLGVMGTRFVYAEFPVVSAFLKPLGATRNGKYSLFENQLALPPVFWKSQVEARIDLGKLEGNFYRLGILQGARAQEMVSYARKGIDEAALRQPWPTAPHLEIRREGPNRWVVEKDRESSGTLVVSQATAPGWVAESGGLREPITPLNAILSEFPARQGVTRITLRYEPYGFRLGAFLSLVGILIAGILTMQLHDARREKNSAAASR